MPTLVQTTTSTTVKPKMILPPKVPLLPPPPQQPPRDLNRFFLPNWARIQPHHLLGSGIAVPTAHHGPLINFDSLRLPRDESAGGGGESRFKSGFEDDPISRRKAKSNAIFESDSNEKSKQFMSPRTSQPWYRDWMNNIGRNPTAAPSPVNSDHSKQTVNSILSRISPKKPWAI